MRKKLYSFAAAILLASTVSTVLAIQRDARTTRELFPNTEDHGRAAVEYIDDQLQVIAAYYYSQRNHDSRWLLIETAITSSGAMTIERDDIQLVRPDGREIPLASQRAFAQDHQRIRPLLQAATTTRHGIGAYIVRNVRVGFDFLCSHSMALSTNSSTPINTVWPGAICFSRHQQVAGTLALTHLLSPGETVDKHYCP